MAKEEAIKPEIVADTSALAIIATAEIDQAVATAKKFPRSIKLFLQEAKELVTLTEKVAEDCIFAIPRGKERDSSGKMVQKFIEGPSVRFAEILASSWGNARCGSRPMAEERGYITAQGVFHDLEKNVTTITEVRRSITGSQGNRFNADMIGVTTNAACSIARRNAALQGIPKALWQVLYDEAKACAIGDAKTLVKKRQEMMAYFQKMQVAEATILEFLGLQGIEDIGLEELTLLRGIATAIKEGTTSIDKAFTVETGEKNSRSKEIFEHLKKEQAKAQEQAPVEPVPEGSGAAVFGVDKAGGETCQECGVTGGHDPHCAKSSALPCKFCFQIGSHADACPDNVPADFK